MGAIIMIGAILATSGSTSITISDFMIVDETSHQNRKLMIYLVPELE